MTGPGTGADYSPGKASPAGASVSARLHRRWQATDPLLPAPADPPPGCGASLAVAGADGQTSATGTCEHWAGTADSLDLTWGAAVRFRLTPQIAGPDVAAALDQLLTRWHDHLAAVSAAAGEDTAAVVNWPSRDVDGAVILLQHGLSPRAVIAARPAGRHRGAPAEAPAPGSRWATATAGRAGPAGASPAGPAEAAQTPAARQGVAIRRAAPADLDAVVRLGLAVIRFDAHFGTVVERPGTAAALRAEAATALASPDAWIWLADRDGEPVGLLYAERPEAAAWIAPMTGGAPVAYLELMGVLAGERGRGVGDAMVAHFHREADAAKVAVTLLHHDQVNPLSGPFWNQQRYRPLWTTWEARPALTLR